MKQRPFTPTKTDKLLLDCLHQDEDRRKAICKTSLDDSQCHALFQTAMRHCVSALLFYRLKTDGQFDVLPESIQKALFFRYMENSGRNMQIFFRLKEILEAFHAHDIPVIVLKGAHLAHTVYPDAAVREMSDIDLLVPPELLKAADITLKSLGYAPDSPCDFDFETKHFAHVPQYNRPSSPTIEIHWNIESPKSPCHFDTSQFWQKTEQFQIQDFNAQGLSPEWLLVHLCTHISYHHGFTPGLRSYYDIAETINYYGETLNWQCLQQITDDARAIRGVYLALFLTKELLGAAVPETTLQALRPSGINHRILMLAQDQFLAENPVSDFHGPRAEVLARKGIWPKVKGFFQRLFLPPKMIARIYGLDPNAFCTHFYYPIRLMDLIRCHKKILWDYARGTDDTRTSVAGVKFLEDWLAEQQF